MAAFTTVGIAAEMQKIDKTAKNVERACTAAVKAGGKLLAEKLAENAPKRTGGLAESVKAGAVKYDAGNGYYCKVAPDGKNAQGESYAKIGNILEYGRRNMAARPWFNPTMEQSESEVTQAMQAAFQKETAKG